MTDIALSSFTTFLSPCLSSTSPLTSRLRFELVRLVSLQLEVVRSYLVRPLAPAAGMLCQFLFMPGIAYMAGLLIIPEREVMTRLGLFLVGSSPGEQ